MKATYRVGNKTFFVKALNALDAERKAFDKKDKLGLVGLLQFVR